MLQNIIQACNNNPAGPSPYETLNSNQGSAYSTARSMNTTSTVSIQAKVDVPAAVVFASASIDATANTFTKAGAVLWTGAKGQFTTSASLPTGISGGTDYWAILVDLTTGTYKFATSLNNAIAGTAVDITTSGSGNQTFTPTTLSGGAIAFQKTNVMDTATGAISTTAADWTDIDTETAVSADATVWFMKVGPEYMGLRVRATTSDGSFQAKLFILSRGEEKK